jgi:ElaB/YqjD/DUF883 family membrane-anchored ribosome-binding protein
MSEPVTPINELNKADQEQRQPVAVPRPAEDDALACAPALSEETVVLRPRSSVSEAAQKFGTVMGKAAGRARELPRRLQELRQRFVVVSGRTREDAASAAAEWKETAKHKAYETRTRAEHLAHEYPVQSILGAAAFAFVLGFALRIWRSNRGE